MQYLVIAEPVEMGVLPPKQMAPLLEEMVLPSLDAMVKLQEEGKVVAGGSFSGAKGGAFIIEAASNEEVNTLLLNMPFWSLFDWKLIPLDSYQHRRKMLGEMLQRIKVAV